MNGNSKEANIEYLIEKNIMQVPNLKYIQPSNSNNHIGYIKYDEEFIYPIKDLAEFYKELGYTKELSFAGVLPDEFIWDTYRNNLAREYIGCLQLLLINYLSKHSDTFRMPAQPVDATHALNRSAGVSKFNVFRGRSLSCLATLFSAACE